MEPLVSILCVTYNHRDYIRRALDSFLAQEADFPFEIIVHDDASTDGTADIIREYQARHPEIIIPILQTENQYSKPDYHSMYDFIFPLARGRYYAHCDGDDYFTDPLKLQRQVDYMRAHPDCAIVTHRALWHVEGGGGSRDYNYPPEEKERDFGLKELFVDGAGMFATNSFLIQAEVNRSMPEAFYVRKVGDYNLLLYAALSGGCHYLPQVMSVHNDGVPGSWSEQVAGKLESHIASDNAIIDMLRRVDAHYGGRYHEEIEAAIDKRSKNRDEYHFRALWDGGHRQEAKTLFPARARQEKRNRIRGKMPWLGHIYDRIKR